MKRIIFLVIVSIAFIGAATSCQTHDQAVHSDAVEQSKMIYGD